MASLSISSPGCHVETSIDDLVSLEWGIRVVRLSGPLWTASSSRLRKRSRALPWPCSLSAAGLVLAVGGLVEESRNLLNLLDVVLVRYVGTTEGTGI